MTATTVEQSRHLVELGIDPSSADMYYEQSYLEKDGYFDPTPIVISEPICFEEHLLSIVPAWSLSALLGLLPDMITVDDWDYDLDLQKCDNGYVVSYTYFPFADESEDLCYFKGETAVECVYGMVCWWFEWKDDKKS